MQKRINFYTFNYMTPHKILLRMQQYFSVELILFLLKTQIESIEPTSVKFLQSLKILTSFLRHLQSLFFLSYFYNGVLKNPQYVIKASF